MLVDRKFNNNLPITKELRPILKELKDKYIHLYDLKVTSQIEDIDEKYSLMSVARIQKAEHTAKLERQRVPQAAFAK